MGPSQGGPQSANSQGCEDLAEMSRAACSAHSCLLRGSVDSRAGTDACHLHLLGCGGVAPETGIIILSISQMRTLRINKKNFPSSHSLNVNRNCVSHSVGSNSLQPHELSTARLLCPWDSPGKNTGVGCHSLLQGVFQTQGSNPGPLHLEILYCLREQGSP